MKLADRFTSYVADFSSGKVRLNVILCVLVIFFAWASSARTGTASGSATGEPDMRYHGSIVPHLEDTDPIKSFVKYDVGLTARSHTLAAVPTPTPPGNYLPCFNPELYGGDGSDANDDTTAIQAAITAAAAQKGGAVCFPPGTWRTTGITVPPKIKLVGQSGNAYFYDQQGGGTTILLTASNTGAINIGENITDVSVHDLELRPAANLSNTVGIKFMGAYPNSAQIMDFRNLTIRNFDIGIHVYATDQYHIWQASYIKVDNLTFEVPNGKIGIRLEAWNSEMNIDNAKFTLGSGAYAIWNEYSGQVHVNQSWALGPSPFQVHENQCDEEGNYNPILAEAFFYINGPHGMWDLESVFAENVKYVFLNNFEDLSAPVTITGSYLGDVRLNADIVLTLIGDALLSDSIQAAPSAINDSRIYIFGKRVNNLTRCLATVTDEDKGPGYELNGSASVVVFDTQFNGVNVNSLMAVGPVMKPVANSAAVNPDEPIFSVGVPDYPFPSRPGLRLGVTDNGTSNHGAFTYYYDFSRNLTDGYLDIVGNQSSPYRGVRLNGGLSFRPGSGGFSSTSTTGEGLIAYNTTSNVLQISENAGAYKNLLKTSSLTTNALLRATDSVGNIGSSLLSDNGTDVFQSSGQFIFSSDVGLARQAAGVLKITDGSSGSGKLKIDVTNGSPVAGVYSANTSLNFASIAGGATAELTITVTGAATGDSVEVAPNGAPENGLIWSGYVSASNTVTVRLANVTGAAIDPAARNWRATVIKF